MSNLPVSWDSRKKTELTAHNFFFSNKRLFRVVPSSPSLNTETNQACILTHITIPCRRWNKYQTRPWITRPSSLLPVKAYSLGQKNWFCNLFLVGVLEVFFLSLSPFPLSLAYSSFLPLDQHQQLTLEPKTSYAEEYWWETLLCSL